MYCYFLIIWKCLLNFKQFRVKAFGGIDVNLGTEREEKGYTLKKLKNYVIYIGCLILLCT